MESTSLNSLRIAVLVKQIPGLHEMRLGADGRLVRGSAGQEMSAYCRRAVSKAVELAQPRPGSSVTVVTLGPPSAADALREAIAWGRSNGAGICGVLITDPAFAGSDTLATARALARVLERRGPFDLILTGKNSLDADTGQVPPQVAELLQLPFATGVKQLVLDGNVVRLHCEDDDSAVDIEVELPALLSCAERLCEPAKVPPAGRAAVPDEAIETVTAATLGPGPWGAAGSPTRVGACRPLSVDRMRLLSPGLPLASQAREAVQVLVDREAIVSGGTGRRQALPGRDAGPGHAIAVIADPGQQALTIELCGAAARLAAQTNGSTVLIASTRIDALDAGSWGADRLIAIEGAEAHEDVAAAVASWAKSARPWAILAGSTVFGREVAARVAARLGAGLTGDAIEVEVVDDRLVAWKSAFGGLLVAAITASSPVQMATIRSGVLPQPAPRVRVAERTTLEVDSRRRARTVGRRREDALEGLGKAGVVIGIGQGVTAAELPELEELRALLGAEFGCTRKLTDAGRMPHARQIGITGRSISPRLYMAIGTSGKFNHMVGVRGARTVLGINPDPGAPLWEHVDVGIVGHWQECVPLVVKELRRALTG